VDRFLIADIRADLPFPSERRFFFDPPFNPRRQVLVHPQPDRVWRVDWQVPAGVDLETERATGALDARIRQVIGDVDYELVWASAYVFHQRMAEEFRVGRVFLAGDAAHVMTPFGARGLNSGVADADNLAWKLALVLGGLAPDRLLDTYAEERRPAAAENLRVTGETMRFMAPPGRLARWRRNAVLRGSVLPGIGPWLRRRVNSGRLSVPAAYPDSPLTGPGGGVPAEDLWCTAPDGTTAPLWSLVGTRFVAVGRDVDPGEWAAAVTGAAGPLPVLPVTAPGEGTGEGTALLVRPDGYVAEAFPADPGGARLRSALIRATAA
jgi:3-(3-hydroxy-phenyl)propionate hydroxylase